MIESKIKTLEEKGFKRWTKGNIDRLYINASQLGLNCTKYNTGNIRSATFQGVGISNCHARKMYAAKTYIDLKTEKVVSDDDMLARAAAELAGIDEG